MTDAYNSQVGQDKFVLNIMKRKENGFFLEIGSNHPKKINNSYILEKQYNWTGIMVEYESKWLPQYKTQRPNSIHIINDATKIDYKKLFEDNNVPLNVDYLQIDLEVCNGSTLRTLERVDSDVMDTYKFATVTFEHDIYRGDYIDTRNTSRAIFEKRGYVRVFSDICDRTPSYAFEDWYVHPDLVDMDYVNTLIENNLKNNKPAKITNTTINWQKISYH